MTLREIIAKMPKPPERDRPAAEAKFIAAIRKAIIEDVAPPRRSKAMSTFTRDLRKAFGRDARRAIRREAREILRLAWRELIKRLRRSK